MSEKLTKLTVNNLRTERRIKGGHFYLETGGRRKIRGATVSEIFKDGRKEKILILKNGKRYNGNTPVSRDVEYC